MPKRQRQHKTGAVYRVTGPTKRTVRMRLVGRAKIHGKRVLMFQPLRRTKKRNTA